MVSITKNQKIIPMGIFRLLGLLIQIMGLPLILIWIQ